MHVGLIGGYGPAATADYYLSITQAIDPARSPFRLTIAHGDLEEAMALIAGGREAKLVAVLAAHAEALRQAGAEICVLSALGFHTYLVRISEQTEMPFCSLTEALRRHVEDEGFQRVGVIGSHYAMSEALLGHDGQFECLFPRNADERNALNQAYFNMALTRRCSDTQRELFAASARSLIERGAEAILLGGTDFALARKELDAPFTLIDPVDVHVRALCTLIEGNAEYC